MSLHLPRELDLRLRDDRRLLREVVSPNQRLAALVDEHLEDYITLFKDAAWRKLHPWGFEVMLSSMHFSLETLLVVTGTLKKLSKYPGFCRLMTGFNSHDQVRATLFEIQVADWCIERGVTKLVEFSPSVQLRGRTKRPDLLWQTTLGALYCECKTPDQFNNRLPRRLDRLHKIAEQEYSLHATWAPDLRLDIFLSDAPDGVERNIRNLVRRAAVSRARAANEREIVDGPVRGVFRHRQQTPLFGDGELDESGTLSVASVTVGPVAVGLNDAHI